MWGKKSKKDDPSDVEVEVSLDITDNLFSIVVTENSKLQSVVSVPTADSTNCKQSSRRRFLQKTSSSDDLETRMATHAHSHRLADTLRPLSPNMSDRRSAMEDSTRGRGRGASCPPAANRHAGRDGPSRETAGAPRLRQQSCPPERLRKSGGEKGDNTSTAKTPRSSRRSTTNKKPNLVTKTAARSRFFGVGRKVIPAPAMSR